MFFHKAQTSFEVRLSKNGRWRFIKAFGKGGPIHSVLWSGSRRASAEKAMAAYLEFGARPENMGDIYSKGGPHETKLTMRRWKVTVTKSSGSVIAYASFKPLAWESCMVIGAAGGALTSTGIQVEPDWRCKGVAEAIHDFVAEIYGKPTVPNGVNGVPGDLSDLAQKFWGIRSERREVPGLTGKSLSESFRRIGRLKSFNYDWQQERMHAPGSEVDRCFAFALAVHEIKGYPIIEAMSSSAGRICWWLELPDGSKLTSEGIWKARENVRDINLQKCTKRFILTDTMINKMKKTWFPNTSFSRREVPVGELLVEARSWAETLLPRIGLSKPQSTSDTADWIKSAENDFVEDFPILSGYLLNGAPINSKLDGSSVIEILSPSG